MFKYYFKLSRQGSLCDGSRCTFPEPSRRHAGHAATEPWTLARRAAEMLARLFSEVRAPVSLSELRRRDPRLMQHRLHLRPTAGAKPTETER